MFKYPSFFKKRKLARIRYTSGGTMLLYVISDHVYIWIHFAIACYM